MALEDLIQEASDSQLQSQIDINHKAISDLKEQIAVREQIIMDAQAILSKRGLAKEGLAAEDSVLITQEFIDHKEYLHSGQGDDYKLGEEWAIRRLVGGTIYIEQKEGYSSTFVSTEMVHRMREAWLEREGLG